MISVKLIGRIGNQLWQYAVCRTVAERLGYLFHIPNDFLGSELFDCSLGINKDLTYKVHYDNYKNNGVMAQFYNPNIFKIEDFTKLVGHFQCERYIADNRENIKIWFSQKNINLNLLNQLSLDDEICVINFRGGDYKNNPSLFLDVSFWMRSVEELKKINPTIKFLVITDDAEEARIFFPDYPVHHFNIADDFSVISHAKYLIIANSTFSWWAAWLNERCKIVIAPKYWMSYNKNEGWWAPGESITKKFCYIGKDGGIISSGRCIEEFNQLNLSYAEYPYK